MTPEQAVIAFSLAAGLLTITPGLDTALVLRTAAAAFGLAAVLAASQTAFEILRWAGAGYMAWLGLNLIFRPRSRFDAQAGPTAEGGPLAWMRRGFLTNLLNPKVGVFYVSFLPQFAPEGVPAGPFLFLLAGIHAVMGLAWFAAIIGATTPIARTLRRAAVVRWLDRLTGGVFIAFGLRLAMERR